MNYTIVYEVTDESLLMIWLPALSVIVALGILLFNLFLSNSPKKNSGIAIGFFATCFTLFFCYMIIPDQLADYNETNERYENGNYETVEGEIEAFIPMRMHENDESIMVENVSFEYSDSDESFCGFNTTKANGGPIYGNGQKVRLGYINKHERNIILRIEVADE
ncbi:MAG: hypothetical protein ACJAWV_004150 [Flammeovirgaceae bacterium]|jgi:hypothetical protein